MPCRRQEPTNREIAKVRGEKKKLERKLCDARTLMFKLVEPESLPPSLQDRLVEHREAHQEHREEDLDHARRQAKRVHDKLKSHVDQINELGGTPDRFLQDALMEAETILQDLNALEVEDLLADDSQLENIYDHIEDLRDEHDL